MTNQTDADVYRVLLHSNHGRVTGDAPDGAALTISIERIDVIDPDRREHWHWRITRLDRDDTLTMTQASKHDRIRSGACGIGGGPRSTLLALASFLGAYAESSENGEFADLFPASLDRGTAQDAADLILLALGGDDE